MRYALMLLWSIGFSTAFAQTKPQKNFVLRSGQVISCKVDHGCKLENVNGKRFFTLDVDGLLVRASLDQRKQVSFADLTITNGTQAKVNVVPADFRIEVDDVEYKRLSYIDPEGNRHARLERPEERIGHGLPSPEYWTSEVHRKAKEEQAAARLSGAPLLQAGTLGPSEVASGRVYFERPNGTTGMNLILPFTYTILEFPFEKMAVPQDGKKKRHAKQDTASEMANID